MSWSAMADVQVGNGASLSVGGGTIDLGCTDLIVSGSVNVQSGGITAVDNVDIAGGTIDGGSGAISASGDWSNQGSFIPGTGSVALVDGCGSTVSGVSGDTSFYEFAASTGTGRLLEIAAGSTQTFAQSLTLTGQVPGRLRLRSSMPGAPAFFSLAPAGQQFIDAVDVQDNDASGGQLLAPGAPAQFNSIDSGGNSNWFLRVAESIPVPTLTLPGLLTLMLMVGWLARRRLVPAIASRTR